MNSLRESIAQAVESQIPKGANFLISSQEVDEGSFRWNILGIYEDSEEATTALQRIGEPEDDGQTAYLTDDPKEIVRIILSGVAFHSA